MNMLIVDDGQALIPFLTRAVVACGYRYVYLTPSAEVALEAVVLRDCPRGTRDIRMPTGQWS